LSRKKVTQASPKEGAKGASNSKCAL